MRPFLEIDRVSSIPSERARASGSADAFLSDQLLENALDDAVGEPGLCDTGLDEAAGIVGQGGKAQSRFDESSGEGGRLNLRAGLGVLRAVDGLRGGASSGESSSCPTLESALLSGVRISFCMYGRSRTCQL